MTEKDGLTYRKLIDACHILQDWRDPKTGFGREEMFIGTMITYFPLHCESELAYLRRDWARFGILWSSTPLSGYMYERAPTVMKDDERLLRGLQDQDHIEYTRTTFGSNGNQPTVHAWPMSLLYQPLEEIRDYFGDDVGLYFIWLGHYAKSLFVMSMFGTVVMIAQPLMKVDGKSGPDQNPLTLVYSLYVGIWSILFLETWRRRESELRFLWGTEGLAEVDEPRRQFMGVLEVNPDTGRQRFVVKSEFDQFMKRVVATFCVFVLILLTAAAATFAYLVRYVELDEETAVTVQAAGSAGGDTMHAMVHAMIMQRSWEIVSAALNLIIIVVFGVVFEGIAEKLNDYENHRTEAEYANALITKNFLFQFVNNCTLLP